TVRVTDQNGLFHDRTFTIAVNNLNETPGNQAPTGLDLTSTAIDENSGGGTTVGRLTAIDADPNDTFTYSLVSDPDGKFRIAGDELTIKPGATLDYETKQFHQVTIRVKDAAGQTFDKLFTITVNDLPEVPGNRKPTDVNVGGLTTKELAATGTVVSTLTAIDDDANDTFTYQLLNPDGRFKISGNQLIVDNGIKLDHEQAASHQVTVRAYDRAGTFFDKTFSIGVGDVDPEVAVGTALDDVLVGGRGKDNFNGSFGHDKLRGGLGNDVLKGDQGRDIFVFDTKAGKKTNYDKILDYTVKDDSIQLDNVVFKKLGKGAPATPAKLNKKFFTVGTEAKDANDYVIYNKKNGVLSYDADGTGSGRAVEIALLKKNLKITAAEFFVI
ncbi:MAG: hypothetical protein K0S56_3801, partial [Microvirga sp.]|nr:hypothetical protein [Microvirga sp.]